MKSRDLKTYIIIALIVIATLALMFGGDIIKKFKKSSSDDTPAPESTASDGAENLSSETNIDPDDKVQHQASDKAVIAWFNDYLTYTDYDDKETAAFTDIYDYQYYARSLDLDKDYFLSPEMWEVFYSPGINKNRDIDNEDLYLIRLDPYKLLEVYAERTGQTVDELCSSLAVTKEQAYFNWGYTAPSVNYRVKHQENTVTYSEEEVGIFGSYNFEDRTTVMNTHQLIVDADGNVTYNSSVTDYRKTRRRDILKAFSDEYYCYSDYTEEEKSPAFKLNGIGIRAIIPLKLPNAYLVGKEISEENDNLGYEADVEITPMVNVSPFAYECTLDDKLDILGDDNVE